MNPAIAVSGQAGMVRAGLIRGGRLMQYVAYRPDAPDGVGDIYTARVTAKVPAMAGSFLLMGGDQTGFLPDSAGGAALTEGDILTVTVTRAAQSGKGPRLAAIPEPPADRLGLTRRGPGPLLDLCGRFPAAGISIDDYALMAALRPTLGDRLRHDAHAFAALEDEAAGLAEPTAALPGGAVMHITPTPALTAIDIDAGSATAANANKSLAQAALNQAIIPELCRQIVLRNLSGAILVDFAGMRAKQRAKLAPAFASALAEDPLRPHFHGITALGFAELSRPRIHPPLHERLG